MEGPPSVDRLRTDRQAGTTRKTECTCAAECRSVRVRCPFAVPWASSVSSQPYERHSTPQCSAEKRQGRRRRQSGSHGNSRRPPVTDWCSANLRCTAVTCHRSSQCRALLWPSPVPQCQSVSQSGMSVSSQEVSEPSVSSQYPATAVSSSTAQPSDN